VVPRDLEFRFCRSTKLGYTGYAVRHHATRHSVSP